MKQTLRRYNAALSMIAVAVLIFSAVVFSTKGITQGGLCQVVMDGMQCEPQPEEAIKTQTDAPNQEVVALTAAPAFSATSMPTSVLTDANGNTVEVDVDAADWTAIDAHYFAENGYTLTDGNYYLSESITTTSTILIDAGTVDLCLNGYTIDANSAGHTVITVGEGAHLSLYDTLDSTQTTTADGDITDAETDDAETDDAETDDAETDEAAADDAETDDAATDDAETDDAETDEVATDDTATEPSTTTGGLITGGYSTGYGAGVYVSANATFYLYGGTIAGNTSEKAAGGVYVADADFTMYGGSISSNTANGGDGGGVYLNGGTFTMQGGSITGNTADGRGGGIVAYNDGALT